jgi:hypothetical protein
MTRKPDVYMRHHGRTAARTIRAAVVGPVCVDSTCSATNRLHSGISCPWFLGSSPPRRSGAAVMIQSPLGYQPA